MEAAQLEDPLTRGNAMNKISQRSAVKAFPRRQQGVVMVIALIVLVAMTLAAIGMSRSIDTSNLVAGNLGFKQASLGSADKGLDTAYKWLVARAGTSALNNNNAAEGYLSSSGGVEPKWTDPSAWATAAYLDGGAEDAAGNKISYVIHRLCTEENTAYNDVGATGQSNKCATYKGMGGGSSGGSMSVGAPQHEGNPQVYYRVTARSEGPRNTVSYVQSLIAITN
jgi:Tfp pilus assembly protein PilX